MADNEIGYRRGPLSTDLILAVRTINPAAGGRGNASSGSRLPDIRSPIEFSSASTRVVKDDTASERVGDVSSNT